MKISMKFLRLQVNSWAVNSIMRTEKNNKGELRMTEVKLINVENSFKKAEEKAKRYLKTLLKHIEKQEYIKGLTKDFEAWKPFHVRPKIFQALWSKNIPANNYRTYIQRLEKEGKLHDYLERSISYIFLRDLGKTLYSPDMEKRIQEVTEKLKKQLLGSSEIGSIVTSFSKDAIYEKGKQEGIELTVIWLFEKLKQVAKHLPKEIDAIHAQRKLLKVIAGVILHVNEQMVAGVSKEERAKNFDVAIRLGYSYGITYPFIDDLLDSQFLNKEEKMKYSKLIRSALLTQKVPEMGSWSEEKQSFMTFIYEELKEAFEYIKIHQLQNNENNFFEQAFIFFQAQEVDRNKDLSNSHYSNEELFVPVILKSASSRLIARSIINELNKDFGEHIFFHGIYNQLADDLADLFIDLENGSVTPYTYYWKYHEKRSDLINPFDLYWAVIHYLIHNVYQSDEKTREVILNRAINGLKRLQGKLGKEQYKNVMKVFMKNQPSYYAFIESLMKKAQNVDFFDKLVRDEMIAHLKREHEGKERFYNKMKVVQQRMNEWLPIEKKNEERLDDRIIEAANYSLESGGKRLRPALSYLLGETVYGLHERDLIPLCKSLEYMHTASLIFDDLPSQDNARFRRGKPTIHVIYNTAVAELTALFLNQKAYEEQTLLPYDSDVVLQLIRYSAKTTADMCLGQSMDLASKGKRLSLEELNKMSQFKTAIGFEASIVMPAILAKVSEEEIETLKKFAYHAGIAFQIKDDLLDVEGDSQLLGKKTMIDAANNSTTFVSILGVEGAKKEMWEHYCEAWKTIKQIPRDIQFLHYFLDYVVEREK